VAKFANAMFEKWAARAEKAEGMGFKRAEQFEKEWYFPHLWNTTLIRQNQGKFIAWLQKIYKAEQAKKFEIQRSLTISNAQYRSWAQQEKKLEARLERIHAGISDISSRMDERAMEVRRIDKRAGTLEERAASIREEISDTEEFIASMREELTDPDLLTRLDEMEADVRELRKLDKPMTEAQLRQLDEDELGGILTGPTRIAAEVITGRRKLPEMPSFIKWLIKKGGLKDDGGELMSVLGGKPNAKGVKGLLNNEGGEAFDEMGKIIANEFREARTPGAEGTPGGGQPGRDEIVEWIRDSMRGQEPAWWIASQTPETLEKIDAGQVALGLEEVFTRAGIIDQIKTTRDVARLLRDELPGNVTLNDLDRIAAEIEAAQGPIPPSVRIEEAEGAIADLRGSMTKVRQVIQDAMSSRDRMGTQVRATQIRAGEARYGERANLGRLGVLDERLSAKERKRDLVLDYLQITQKHKDDLRLKMEEDIGRYEGNTTVEAQARLKAREKAEAERTPEQRAKQARLTSADEAVDSAVRKIVDERTYDKSDEELRSIAAETMKRILGTPDGRLPYDLANARPDVGWKPGSSSEPPRGGLAHRQLNVSNAEAKEWIENDLEKVMSVHLRTFVPDTMLVERFGDVRMSMPLKQISEDYTRLVREVEQDKKIPDSKKGAMIKKLADEEDMVITVVAGVRDRIRGVYGWSPELRNVARAARAAKQINNLTSMGMAAVGSLADMAGIVMLHGFKNVIRDGWGPYLSQILRNTNAGAEFKRQMRAMGIGVETVINARQHTMDDVMDGAAPQSRFERALTWGNDKFFIGNLLAPQTDAFKQIAAHVVMNEILRASEAVAKGTATKKQLTNLAASNISQEMATRIYGEYTRKGGGIEKIDGVLLPNTGTWQDQHLAEMFSAAVNREVDIAVVTPGQEKSFWMSHQTLSVLGQFKSFTQSSNERLILGNLQRRDTNVLQGVVFSVMLGMASYKLAGFISGRETSNDPATMIKEGMTRANTLGWAEEGNAIASKLTGGSVDVYRLIGADKPPSRFASRSAADMLLGPTWAKIESLSKIAGSAGTGNWDQYDTTATRRFIFLQNVLWLNRGFQAAEEGVNHMFGIPMKPPTSP
jgi:hypothetical protein